MDKSGISVKRVVIIDDHPMIRAAVTVVFSGEARFCVAAEAGTAKEGLEAVKNHKPDFVVLDLQLPDQNGLLIINKIRFLSPATRVIVLTMYSRGDFIRKAMAAGAMGYIVKTSPPETLLEAVRRIEEGGHYLDKFAAEAVAGLLARENGEDKVAATAEPRLSKREREIMHHVARGSSMKEIAFMLSLSPKTVENHRYRLMRKLNVSEPIEVVKYALRKGILDLDDWLKERAPSVPPGMDSPL
jgi:DNA-binding NarL/FixJ family response regulator